MASLNKVFLIGNLTSDPELRHTPGGVPVADLTIAINREYSSKDGERKTEVTYIDLVVWSRLAENCTQYLAKGRPIMVEGRLQLDTWENQQGEKRSKLRVVAENIQFLGGKPREGSEEKTAKPRELAHANEDASPTENIGEDDIPF
jgi:single-strand DNA-binding protein